MAIDLMPEAAVLLLAVASWGGVQTYRLSVEEKHEAQEQAAFAQERLRATDAALDAQTRYRALEAQMQALKEQAQNDYDAQQTRNASALAAARVGTDKLRKQLAAYSTGGGATSDTLAAADQRAAALGELLAAALRADAEHAASAEANGDAVRTLLAAWPRSGG